MGQNHHPNRKMHLMFLCVCCLVLTVLSFIYSVHFYCHFNTLKSYIMTVHQPLLAWGQTNSFHQWTIGSPSYSLFSGPTGGAWGWHVFWRRWDIWRRRWGMDMPGVVVRWLLSFKNASKCPYGQQTRKFTWICQACLLDPDGNIYLFGSKNDESLCCFLVWPVWEL